LIIHAIISKGGAVMQYKKILVVFLTTFLITGLLIGCTTQSPSVPKTPEEQAKQERFQTFSNNIQAIEEALEVYKKKEGVTDILYPDSITSIMPYLKQDLINPYTGTSMLGNNKESGVYYINYGSYYNLCVSQDDVDDVNNNGRTNDILPIDTKYGCDHLAAYSYKSRIDGFEPEILGIIMNPLLTNKDGTMHMTIVETQLKQPDVLPDRAYKVFILVSEKLDDIDSKDITNIVDTIERTFGSNSATVINIPSEPNNAFDAIAKILSPLDNPPITYPIAVVLDEDNLLLVVFWWNPYFTYATSPYYLDSDLSLKTITRLGAGYSGVYVPASAHDDTMNPQLFSLLTDNQKQRIQKAMKMIGVPVKIYVD